MKKIQVLFIVLSFLLVLSGQVLAYPDQYLNQIGVDFDLAPVSEPQMNYLPLETIASYYGMDLTYNQNTKEITGRWGKTTFSLKYESRVADVNGKREILDLPVIDVNGHTLVPVTFLENLIQVEFRWKRPSIIISDNNYYNSLRVSVYSNKENYEFGEQVVVTLILKNTSQQKLRIPMSSSQVYDVYLTYKGYEIWRWSKNMMFTTAITNFELDPGESKVFTVTLPRELILTPAQYQIQGAFVSKPELKSDIYTFNIR